MDSSEIMFMADQIQPSSNLWKGVYPSKTKYSLDWIFVTAPQSSLVTFNQSTYKI